MMNYSQRSGSLKLPGTAPSQMSRRSERLTVAERLILLSVVLVPLQQAFTIDVGFPLKPSELLIGLAIVVFPFRKPRNLELGKSGVLVWGLIAVVAVSGTYRLLVNESIGFVPGFTRSADVDLLLYMCYALLVALFVSVGRGLSKERLGRAIVVSTWVMGIGVLIQFVLGSVGRTDILELLNFETKAKGLALGGELANGVMRSGPFVEGQHLGFYAAGCVVVALAFRRYVSATVAVLCLIYSQSTTGFISIAVGASLVIIIRPSIALLWKFVSAGLAAAVIFSSSDSLRTLISYQLAKLGFGDFTGEFSGSSISMDLREVKTLIGLRIMGEEPLIGVGPGRYGVHFFEHTEGFEIPEYYFTLDDHRAIAENVYAQIGAELGIIGLIVWILLLLVIRPKISGTVLPDIALWIGLLIGVSTQSNWTFLPIWVFILYLSKSNSEPVAGRDEKHSESKPKPEEITSPISGRSTYAKRKAYRAS